MVTLLPHLAGLSIGSTLPRLLQLVYLVAYITALLGVVAFVRTLPVYWDVGATVNFPLPLELREMVYSHLLGVRHDYMEQSGALRRLYTFHGEILAINKSIRMEALAYVRRTQQLVCLDYTLPGDFGDLFLAFEVPAVRMPVPSSVFQSHPFHIRFRLHEPGRPYRDSGTVLLLLQDMPALCDILRMLAVRTCSLFVAIDQDRNTPSKPWIGAQGDDPYGDAAMGIDVTFRAEDAGPPTQSDTTSQAFVLEYLRTIKGGNVHAKLRGFGPSKMLGTTTQSVINDMRPALVWLRAQAWDYFELMLCRKRRADALLSSGSPADDYLARLIYGIVASEAGTFIQRANPPDRDGDDAYVMAWSIGSQLVDDLKLSQAQSDLSGGCDEDIDKIFEGLASSAQQKFSRGTWHLHRLSFASTILTELDMELDYRDGFQNMLPAMETASSDDPGYEQIMNDIQLAKDILANPGWPADLSYAQTTAFKSRVSVKSMPLPIIDSLPSVGELGRPEGLLGWEDVLHKATMSRKERKAIRKLQRRLGRVDTAFSV